MPNLPARRSCLRRVRYCGPSSPSRGEYEVAQPLERRTLLRDPFQVEMLDDLRVMPGIEVTGPVEPLPAPLLQFVLRVGIGLGALDLLRSPPFEHLMGRLDIRENPGFDHLDWDGDV